MRAWRPRDPDRVCRTRRGESAERGQINAAVCQKLREAWLWQQSTRNASYKKQTYAPNLGRGDGHSSASKWAAGGE